ncbi:MAG: metal-dependent hydrolase [Chloroflexi bacterium]|nr:metal-dependent hydrolase [Chloroflexota bacterium]
MTARFLGHSCWQLSTEHHSIVIDPFLTGNPLAAVHPEDLNVDAVLVTHGHSDHLGDTLAIAKRCDALVVGCFEVATYLGQKGARVHAMHLGGKHTFPFGAVKMIPALHGSGLVEDGQIIYLGNPAGFVIEMGDRAVYHSGDTALFSDMKLVSRQRKMDLALLPIGDNFTMGIDDAVEAVRLIEPVRVIPMHYNTFEVVRADPEEFARRVAQQTRSVCEVVQPGQEIQI